MTTVELKCKLIIAPLKDDAVRETEAGRKDSDKYAKVSVVMSVYNGARYLSRAIESILCQTFTDFELIVIDDGSCDQTPKILEDYRQRDQRVRIIPQENKGLTQALIRGCHEARGEYIARHDADDWSEPTRLEVQVRMLDDDASIGFVSCASQCVGPDNELLEIVKFSPPPIEATQKLLDERCGPPAHGSVTFRRSVYELVGGYHAEFYFGQDSDLWMRMGERSLIAYSPEVLYSFRRDVNAISGQMGFFQRQFGVLGQACRSARRDGKSEETSLAAAGLLTKQMKALKSTDGFSRGSSSMAYLIGSTLSKLGHPSAGRYLWQSIRFNPMNWRAWARIVKHTCRCRGH